VMSFGSLLFSVFGFQGTNRLTATMTFGYFISH